MALETETGGIRLKRRAMSTISAGDGEEAAHRARCRKLGVPHGKLGHEESMRWTMFMADGTVGMGERRDAIIRAGMPDKPARTARYSAQYGCVDAERIEDVSGLKLVGTCPDVISLAEAREDLAKAVADGDRLWVASAKDRVRQATMAVKA
jgi:hypothetical protein